MFNGLSINPAYAGTRDVLSLSAFYRDQWIGFEGAPVYQSLTAHAPIKNNKMGLGLFAFNQQEGISKTTDLYLNYAYRFRVFGGQLSLGLKAGVNTIKVEWDKVETVEPDKAFDVPVERYLLPNFGVGAYFDNKKGYVGISILELLQKESKPGEPGYSMKHDPKEYNILFTSGVVINTSDMIKLKPSVFFKYHGSSTLQFDLTTNVIYKERIWLGLSYRSYDAIATILELQATDQVRFGYAYDFPVGTTVDAGVKGSHEVMLLYELIYRVKASHPRYF